MRRTTRQYADALLSAVDEKGADAPAIARRCIALLARDGALKKFDAVCRAFVAAWDHAHGEAEVTVTTARSVPKATLTTVAQAVRERTGVAHVRTATAIDLSVIGGAVLQWGDTILDGSVRRQLMELRKTLVAS